MGQGQGADMTILLEVCVDSPEGMLAAIRGGADRVEVCSALALGGLTPTTPMMVAAAAEDMPFVAMIRPRAGDFVWSKDEVDHMQSEIDEALELGTGGVVLGANRPDGRLDSKILTTLLKDLPDDIDIVLHRSVDLTPDPLEAVDAAIALGFTRILTSGGAVRAMDGIGRIKGMIDRAKGRIAIIPGAGITPGNVGALLALLPVDQVHASCAIALPQDPRAVAMGFTGAERRETSLAQIRAMKAALSKFG
jgi:copper homeostasis protein